MCALTENEKKNCLYKPQNLVIRRVDDFYLALNSDLPNIMVMDEIGKRFFDLCNGKRTADEIIEIILKEKPHDISIDELRAFISSMIDSNFLFWKPPSSPRKIEQNLYNLRQLYLHITRACNLRCKHCYVEAGEPLDHELTAPEMLRVIDDFATLGGETLIITGGEPFLRKEALYGIFKEAKNVGIKEIFIETNGTLLSNHDIDKCKKYDINLAVSLDGAVPETNDFIRGSGTYQKTIETIKKLVSANVKVKIGMTIMKLNYKEAQKMVLLAKKLNVNSLSFSVVRAIGRAEANRNLLLSLEEMYTIIIDSWKKARELEVTTQLEDQFKSFEKLTRRDTCGAGTARLLVSSNGDVYPCNMFLEFPEFKAGNLRKQRLKEIWENAEALKVLRRLSVLDINGCNICDLKFVCGICPAEIYKTHGGFHQKPEFCSLYKELTWTLLEELGRKMWNEGG
ncbi:MAG: radical SAM protein [Candidatus Bathyarchaeia archaeon]